MTTAYVSDPTGNTAVSLIDGARPSDPDKAVQCTVCRCLGSTGDPSRWPVIAGRLVHVRHHAQPTPAPDGEGYIAPPRPPRRTLCGPARRLGKDQP